MTKTYQEVNGTFYDSQTPAAVIAALETARANGTRIRLFYGDAATGQPWLEENDVAGTVGRSTGPRKVPLLIANSRSMGGGAIMDSCIVAIITAPGVFSYRHPGFAPGNFNVTDSDMPEYAARVLHNGEVYARCRTIAGGGTTRGIHARRKDGQVTGAITKGARVRITGGSRKGKTGEAVKPHAGQGFAGYWCIRIDGADWEAPLFAAPVEALELI